MIRYVTYCVISIFTMVVDWLLIIILIFLGKLMSTHLGLSTFQLREHCMLGDRSAQYEMEIQTILTGILPFHN